jgi:BON domain
MSLVSRLLESALPVSRWRAALAPLLLTCTLIAACSMTPPTTPEQAYQDKVVADQIDTALGADPTYYYRHVDVRVDSGVALLSGYVWSTEALYNARRIAAGVPGVTRVVDQMELERGGNRGGGHTGSG